VNLFFAFSGVVSDRLRASTESEIQKRRHRDAGVRSPVVPSRTLPSARDFSHCGSVRTFGDVLEMGIAALRFKGPKTFIFGGFPPFRIAAWMRSLFLNLL
jgi:hypothetical protein